MDEAVTLAATVGAPPTSISKSAVAFDNNVAKNPMGLLSTGMGYKPETATGSKIATQYIGGAVLTVEAIDPTP